MKYGDTRTSKASPIKWLMYFLSQYSPGENCRDKYVLMDQGGKLLKNPEIQNLFTSKGYKRSKSPLLVLRLLSKMALSSKLVQILLSSSGPTPSTMPCNYPTPSLKLKRTNLPSSRLVPPAKLKTYPTSELLAAELG